MTNKTQNSNTKKTKLVALYFVALHISGVRLPYNDTVERNIFLRNLNVPTTLKLQGNFLRCAARENRTPI